MAKATLNLLRPITLILIIGALVAGCAAGKHRYAGDTKGKHKINCSGTMQSWDDCREKASEICGENRYDVLWYDNRYGTFRSMTIVCTVQERFVEPGSAGRPGGS